MMGPWWVRFPERYHYELEELDRAGIQWARDEGAFKKGFLRLELTFNHDGTLVPLVVTFPDLYPYFRFEVTAPTLDLPHHQNPFEKNLCLMGRATHHWDTFNTVASVLQQQLSLTITIGQSDDAEAAFGVEQDQAEPYSDYYAYAPGMVVLPGEIPLKNGQTCGLFTVQTNEPPNPEKRKFLRGSLVSMMDATQVPIIDSFYASSAFQGETYGGFWVRLSKPIPSSDPGTFLNTLLTRVPNARQAMINEVDGGFFQFWGVAFPEETSRRTADGLGWVILSLFSRSLGAMVRATPAHFVERPRTAQRTRLPRKTKKR